MFRRSFQILLVATLLALAAIIGYALTMDGAPESLARAEQLLQKQEYRRAIAELNSCEGGSSLQQDNALRERLLRLRYRANTALENHRGALRDVESLLRDHGDDPELQLERIRLLTAIGDGEQARQLARAFVAAHPDDGSGLEVAAAACAEAYRATFASLQERIVRDVASGRTDAGRAAFATYVFRPDGDAEVAMSADVLADLYAVDARLAARWPVLLGELRSLREQVQEGLGYCQRSLEAPDAPSTALTTWAQALATGGRVDDMLIACEIQRRRSTDAHTADVGLVAVLTLLEQQANSAAAAAAARWLPSAQLQPRLDAGLLGDAAPDLLLARTIAAWRLGDAPMLRRTLADVQVLQRAGQTTPIPLHTAAGMLHYWSQAEKPSDTDAKNAENNLHYVVSLLQRDPPRPGWPDLLELLLPLRVELLQKIGAPDADLLALFDSWQVARPDALAPRLAFVRYLLATKKLPAAHAVLGEAVAAHPTDAELFDLRLQLARADDSQPGQDGPSLLAQCLRRGSAVPDVTQPIGYLLCAEAAMRGKYWLVARECARSAIDAFPQVLAPRLLAVEATLCSGQAAAAAQQVRQLLDLFPVDAATALLALRAHSEAGLPTADLLWLALPACAPGPEIRMELLRGALAEAPPVAAAFARDVLQDTTAPATLRLLAGRAMALAGQPMECRRLLESVIAESDGLPASARLDLAQTITAWTMSASPYRDDASLLPDVRRMLARTDLRDEAVAPILLQAAADLAASHAQCAYELVLRGLAIAAPPARTGTAFALAGRLACRQRLLHLAEEHWLAALAFTDGHPAAEDLARLLLAQGRSERAVQVYQLVETGTDAALAARCGAPERAVSLATAAVTSDAADLLAQATLAALGAKSRADWQTADQPTTELRLDLLALLQNRDLAPEAVERARALANVDPASPTTQLLLARACLLDGEVDEAARIHQALRTRANAMLWREVALAAAHSRYQLDPALEAQMIGAVANGDVDGSPAVLDFGLARMAAAFQRTGHPDVAQVTLDNRSLLLPRATVLTAADVDRVATMSNPRDAWYVLGQALPERTGAVHALARTRLYEVADRLVTERGSEAKDVYEAARSQVVTEGAYGCIVHFLLDHGSTFPSLQPDAATAHELLLAQLELAGTGKDPGPWVLRSVDRLQAEQGATATRRDVEAALRRHPTCLPLWHARAVVMVHTPAGTTGIEDLRRVLAHAVSPADTLAFLVLAAAAGVQHDDDEALLAGLPPAQFTSPDGFLARGLLLLRRGNPDEAVGLLTNAPPQRDGLHLFALALANLQSRAVEGATRARAALQRLAADYPSSSLARYAGSFATQLLPR